MNTTSAKPIRWHMPHLPNKEMLAALGAVSVRHSFLDHVLRRTIKTLDGTISHQEADRALAREPSRVLRELVAKFAAKKLGKTSTALLKLKALLSDCERLTERRNAWIHNVWAIELDGAPLLVTTHGEQPVPTHEEVSKLAEEIYAVAVAINQARLDGFLSEALGEVAGPKAIAHAKAERE